MITKYPYEVRIGLLTCLRYKFDTFGTQSKISNDKLQQLISAVLYDYEQDFAILINDMINSIKEEINKSHD